MSNPIPNHARRCRGAWLIVLWLAAWTLPPAGPARAGAIGAQQVFIETRVVEVARTPLRELGFDWQTGTFRVAKRDLGDIPGLKDLLAGDLSETLADPSAVTQTGNAAEFDIDGEPGSLRDMRLRLDVVPTVTGDGRVRLGVTLRLDGTAQPRGEAPAIEPRKLETTQTVENGGSLLIGGVFDRPGPWYRELPLVGGLFRERPSEAEPVELLVVVTPWIVDRNRGSSASRVPPQIFRHRPDPDVSAPPKIPNQNPKQPPAPPSYPHGPSDRLQP